MNMIDYYLLRAVVSQKLFHFGSSWSSDTAFQVTCIVRRHMLSKFMLFGCCHLFLPHSGLCFSFPTLLFLVSRKETQVCFNHGQVPFRTSVLSFLSYFEYRVVEFPVSHCNEPNPQPESAAVGRVTAISPFSKRVRRSACFLS